MLIDYNDELFCTNQYILRTRSGLKVTMLTRNARGPKRLVGLIHCETKDIVKQWYSNGYSEEFCLDNKQKDSCLCLIRKPKCFIKKINNVEE